jgi:hypothetical protein
MKLNTHIGGICFETGTGVVQGGRPEFFIRPAGAQWVDQSAEPALTHLTQLTRAGLPVMPCMAAMLYCTKALEGPKQKPIVMAVFGAN